MRPTIATTVAAAVIAFAAAVPAGAHENESFEAQVEGLTQLSSLCEAGVCTIVFDGTGAANVMGRIAFKIELAQDFNIRPCNPYSARATFTAKTGSIAVSDRGTVCPNAASPHGPATIASSWEITGGTGEFSGVTGSGTSQGTIGGNGPVVHFSGTIAH